MNKSAKAYLWIMAVLIVLVVITNSDRWNNSGEDPGEYSESVTVTATPAPTLPPATPTKKPVVVTATPRPATPTPRPATPTPQPAVNLFEGYSIPQYRTRYTALNSVEQHIYREIRATAMRDGNTFVIRNVQYKTYADSIGRAM
ncbi:MAG: hypothetical protein IKT60_06735, partial [Clostridia bacterium]|nr:hypothetical protein [Clostridia bacterium]